MQDLDPEIEFLQTKLRQQQLPPALAQKAERMLARLRAMSKGGSGNLGEFELASKYIDWISAIPFGKYTTDNLDLTHAKEVLDAEHYGLADVKERVLEFIATRKLIEQQHQAATKALNSTNNEVQPLSLPSLNFTHNPGNTYNSRVSSPSLCFIGVQGVGKTTMARAIAKSLGRGFGRIALGAFASVHEIRGKSRADSGAEPGQIVKGIIRSGSLNPVILLDELDKVSDAGSLKADIMAALLEVLDPSQNHEFTDRYLDHPLDLSQVIFIATANNVGGITAALLDRLELIRFSSYSDQEKEQIGRNYLLPKIRSELGLDASKFAIADDVWPQVIRPFGMDPGIRELERTLRRLTRKVARQIVEGHPGQITITTQNFRDYIPEEIQVYT